MQRLDQDDADFLDDLWSRTDHAATISARRDQLSKLLKDRDRRTSKDQPRVRRILWWSAQYGLRDRYYGVEHGPRVAYVTPDRVGTMPKRYAHKPVNPRTGKANGYVQAVMVELSWQEFFVDLRRIKEQWAALGRNIEILDRIAALKDDYPLTKNPREACVLAGIDPDILLDFA